MSEELQTPKKQSSRNALDAAWGELPSSTKVNKPRSERDVSEAVRKALNDACRWAGPEERDCAVHEGLTLRQRLERDKRAALNGDKTKVFGKTYYLQLRQWYGAKSNTRELLQMKPDHKISPELFKAIAQMLRKPPNRSYMSQWSNSCTSLQENDVVGMCRAMLELCPQASGEQLHTATDIIKGIARADGWSTFPDIHRVMREKIDECLLQVGFWPMPGIVFRVGAWQRWKGH